MPAGIGLDGAVEHARGKLQQQFVQCAAAENQPVSNAGVVGGRVGFVGVGFGDAGDKLTISTFFEESSKSIISLTQAYRTGDLGPMNAIHQRSMSGNGHMVLQGYSMIGEALSRTALVDTALTKAADWHNGVPNEFKTSASWWAALESDAASIMDAVKGAAITIGEKVGGTKQ